MSKRQKTAIVTGGSGAIGGAICKQLAEDGFRVVVHYGSSEAEAAKVVRSIGDVSGEAIAIAADVTQHQQVASLFEKTVQHFGGVDVVVANAGTVSKNSIATSTLDEFDKVISVNLKGAYLTVREAAKTLRDNGRIVLMSSGLAARPMATTGIYSASKAALDALAVSLSKELGNRGITVNTVQPGATVPGMFERSDEETAKKFASMSPFNRLGKPEDIASVVAFLVSESGQWITGQAIRADGGSMN